jgi:hypothetical protein
LSHREIVYEKFSYISWRFSIIDWQNNPQEFGQLDIKMGVAIKHSDEQIRADPFTPNMWAFMDVQHIQNSVQVICYFPHLTLKTGIRRQV